MHAEAASEGTTVSELVRELVDAASSATPPNPREHCELVQQSVRFSQDRLDAAAHSARSVGLDVALWLMLLTTPAGDVLIEQLAAAKRTRRDHVR